jgi:hypothetical protein
MQILEVVLGVVVEGYQIVSAEPLPILPDIEMGKEMVEVQAVPVIQEVSVLEIQEIQELVEMLEMLLLLLV